MTDNPRFFSRPVALSLATGWTIILIVLLSLPGSSVPESSLWEYDKLGHAGIFFVLALLWMNAMSADGWRIILFLLICGLALAPASEWYQSVLPIGRTADPLDSVADAVGFVLGTGLWILLIRLGK